MTSLVLWELNNTKMLNTKCECTLRSTTPSLYRISEPKRQRQSRWTWRKAAAKKLECNNNTASLSVLEELFLVSPLHCMW